MEKNGPTGKTACLTTLLLTGFFISWANPAWGASGGGSIDHGHYVADELLIKPKVNVYASNAPGVVEPAESVVSATDSSSIARFVRTPATTWHDLDINRIENYIDGVCGNQVCDSGESEDNCPEDCAKIRNIDYWTYTDFPIVSEEERNAFCEMNPGKL